MNEYIIDFQEKAAVVVKKSNSETQAIVNYPTLEDEIEIPVNYKVTTPDDKSLVTICSSHPEKGRIRVKNGNNLATLIIGGNQELVLKTNNNGSETKFDVPKLDIDELGDEAEELKQAGWSHGYKLRSTSETGSLYLFEKDNSKRAVLTIENENYLDFLPVVMLDKIRSDAKGKKVKKVVPEIVAPAIVRDVKEGPYVKWIKETYTPRMLKKAFEYQDQEGEKERMFEYLDRGLKPVILNGPTGNGKTILAKHYAHSRGRPYYANTGTHTFKLSSAWGKFVPSGPDNAVFAPGPLTLAAVFGGLYHFEEMAPVDPDEITGLNAFLESMEFELITQFGYELVTAHEDFRFVASGNFHANYTTNEHNAATLQRFSELKIGYPDRDNTIDILQARANGITYDTAEMIADIVIEMRKEAKKFSEDLGLKGAVEIAQRIQMGTNIGYRELIEDNIVNPLTTYEDNTDKRNGQLFSKLMGVVDTKLQEYGMK